MAVPNYTYLKLKMPGPNGVITVGPTYKHAFECDVECVEYAEALAESEALIADLENLSKEVPDVKHHAGNFEPAETVKAVPLDPSGDTTKQLPRSRRLDAVQSSCTALSIVKQGGLMVVANVDDSRVVLDTASDDDAITPSSSSST
uniref:protein-serine/threonine phosphatase n=1 Tax=Zea mays TaxID=4577 RepID=A0A804QJR2_MAIZE